jgi:hypothetical protein
MQRKMRERGLEPLWFNPLDPKSNYLLDYEGGGV